MLLLLLLGCHRPTSTRPTGPPLPAGLSAEVAAVMDRYPTDGSYPYYWPPDDGVWWGTTHDVWYLGVLLSPGDPEHRSHCVGITWEIAMEVLQAAAGEGQPINGLSPADMLTFRTDWFVREVGGLGAAEAVERAGVGLRVPEDQLQRGDFLQMWGAASGHSGIFDRYERTDDGRPAIRYWSVHPFLGAIGTWTDAYGPYGLRVVYGARLLRREDWRPTRGEERG